MSFMLTTKQYRNKTKFVTRRLGWKNIKTGEVLNGVEKAQGLKKGEKMVKMGQHIVRSSRWEPLNRMVQDPEYGAKEVILEGFPEMSPGEFVEMFCKTHRCTPDREVNRIRYEYL